jgi:hypothetical protein
LKIKIRAINKITNRRSKNQENQEKVEWIVSGQGTIEPSLNKLK